MRDGRRARGVSALKRPMLRLLWGKTWTLWSQTCSYEQMLTSYISYRRLLISHNQPVNAPSAVSVSFPIYLPTSCE